MDRFIIALIETSVALFFFYFVYILWLKKLTFFKENRFYLLLTAMASLFIPWLNFTLPAKPTETIVLYNLLDTVSIFANGYEQTLVQKLSTLQWLVVIYVSGVVTMFVFLVYRILKITRISKCHKLEINVSISSNVKFVDADVVPFSFLNKIYINPNNLTKKQLTDIIAHENVHVTQQHTYDCLFYELLIVFFWFNPIVYKYRKAAKEIHEYLADEGAIRTGIASEAYQKLLFEQATGVNMLNLGNSFNYSLIKNRLVMLTKIRSNKVAKVRLLMVLPVLFTVIVVFACSKNDQGRDQDNVVSVEEGLNKNGNLSEQVYFTVDDMPEYPGGDLELRKFIATNIVYPAKAKEERIQGRVFIQFHVDSNGKVCDAKVVRGVNELLDKEALRVIMNLPQWKPGMHKGVPVKVSFTVPINFQLN